MLTLFDSHCHLDHPKLQALQPELWQQCQANGVQDILLAGTQMLAWPGQIALCQQNPHWHLSIGLHPYFLSAYQPQQLCQLEDYVQQANPIAIGEIGLDWHLPEPTWQLQEEVFVAQLAIATYYGLPAIVHVRKCHDKVLKLLHDAGFAQGGIIHAFSGNLAQAKRYADLGFKLGIGGTITYPRASKTRALASQVPLSWLVLETDAPDMPMAHQQHRLNRPDHLPYVLQTLAQLRHISLEEAALQTRLNTLAVLRLD